MTPHIGLTDHLKLISIVGEADSTCRMHCAHCKKFFYTSPSTLGLLEANNAATVHSSQGVTFQS
jgi:hypothetical protein